jgi:hypothetical protein
MENEHFFHIKKCGFLSSLTCPRTEDIMWGSLKKKETLSIVNLLLGKKRGKKWTQYARSSLMAPSLQQAPLGESGPLAQIPGDVLGLHSNY